MVQSLKGRALATVQTISKSDHSKFRCFCSDFKLFKKNMQPLVRISNGLASLFQIPFLIRNIRKLTWTLRVKHDVRWVSCGLNIFELLYKTHQLIWVFFPFLGRPHWDHWPEPRGSSQVVGKRNSRRNAWRQGSHQGNKYSRPSRYKLLGSLHWYNLLFTACLFERKTTNGDYVMSCQFFCVLPNR